MDAQSHWDRIYTEKALTAPEATVLQDYSAKELAVQPEDEVEVEEVRHDWVLVRNTQGEIGGFRNRT